MGITYTPEQQKVIDVHGRNILVSAAAGSGKTAVLVERIVKMISDSQNPVDIDRLLVVTFTNAAAAEMRERISLAIAKRLDAEPGNEHLQKQATLIHNAQITTIDSFCMFVIRNNFNDIGLDPGFRVADEGELKLLKQDVMSEMLEQKFTEGTPSFLSCVDYFSNGSRDSALEAHILKLYQFAESCPWPEEWLEERKQDYAVCSLEETSWMRFLMEQVRRTAEDCVYKVKECLAVCEQPDGPYMYAQILEQEAQRIEKLLLVTKYKDGYSAFGGMVFDRLPSKKDDSVSGAKREYVQNVRKEIKDIFKSMTAKYFPAPVRTVEAYMEGCREAVCELINLTMFYKKKLDGKKRESNIVDFSDMEHLALSILVKKTQEGEVPTGTALDYRAFFKEILIDEYQDSNLVQEYLLKSISGEDEGVYNRFMVGDVKQSIYKFRLARPEIFMEKYHTYEADSDTKERINLHKNFRSRKEVLDSVNYIFAQIMEKRLGGVEYDDEAALYPGAGYPEQEKEDNVSPNKTELLLVRTPGRGKEENEDGEKTMSSRQREAYGVAKRIKELTRKFLVTDKESGKLRPAQYRDIVILLRTNAGWDEDFKKILKDEGIPTHVASKTGYFAAKEIQTLLQLLRILDNPRQDIPLYGVLKSYFGGFKEEEIVQIKISAQDKKESLYMCLKEMRHGNAKVEKFWNFLEEYRNKTVYMPIYELLRDIIAKTGYLHYVSVLPGGEQRSANVEILLEKAAAFENTSYYGLFHFIRYIEQLEKYDVDYGEANMLDENADVVRIMSIHKSKGLEFPICFVCGLAKRFNMMDTNGKMIADIDMGIGVDYVDAKKRLQSKTVRKNVIAEKMRLDNLGEELRVLYVALTRAKEKLIMTGAIEEPENKIEALESVSGVGNEHLLYSDLAGAGNFLDFILPAIVKHPSSSEVAVDIVGEPEFAAADISEQAKTEGARRQLLLAGQLGDEQELDQELLARMKKVFSYQYENKGLSDLYTKTTVSELKKMGEGESEDFSFRLYEEEKIVPYIPRFMKETETLGGAGRGNAFHKVMELIDFAGNTDNIEEQVSNMVAEGRLEKEYGEAVSCGLIKEFLSTSLADRMAAAERKGRLYKEQPFVLGIPAKEVKETYPEDELILIQGIIDVYFEEDGELVVADYKTDRADTPQELTGKYRKQLDYYARALEQLTGLRVKEKIIYSFGLRQEIML